MMKVLLATDDPFVTDVLRALVADRSDMWLAGTASSARQAEVMAANEGPDVAIVHASIAGGGPACVSAILAEAPGCAIVGYGVEQVAARAMVRAGAIALVPRGGPTAELLDAVSRAARGQASMPAEVMSALAVEPDRLVGLEAGGAPSDQGHFQAILDSAPEAIIVVDPQGLIVFANARTFEIFGYERGQLLGERVETLLPERYRRSHEAERLIFTNGLRADHKIPGGNLIGRRADGSDFPAEITMAPTVTEEGTLVTVIVRDRTKCGCVDGDLEVPEVVSGKLSARSRLLAAAVE